VIHQTPPAGIGSLPSWLYEVHHDDTTRESVMRLFHRTHKSTTDRRSTIRAVTRAAGKAPTPAARQELLGLMTRL
jgi:hypothetical protein